MTEKGVLGLIPARGGSKGLPRKNIRMLRGKPLIAWTVDAARASGEIDQLIVSTDDEEVATVARSIGCEVPFLRPPDLARDETPAIDVALHGLEALREQFEFLVWLQPTSPLRRPEDITACVRKCRDTGAPAYVSIVRASESPHWMFVMTASGDLQPVVPQQAIPVRRQDLPPAYLVNGAVYVARTEWLRRHRSFLGPGVRGYEMPADNSIDIDSIEDWQDAEAILASRG